jgi:hypothetical protein
MALTGHGIRRSIPGGRARGPHPCRPAGRGGLLASLVAALVLATSGVASTAVAQGSVSPSPVPSGSPVGTDASPSIEGPSPSMDGEAATLPPDGVYQATITPADLLAKGVLYQDAVNNAGSVDWTIQDGKEWTDNHQGEPPCGGTLTVHGAAVTSTADGTGGCSPSESYDFRWTLVGDQLIVTFVEARLNGILDQYSSTFGKAYLERSWTKVQ